MKEKTCQVLKCRNKLFKSMIITSFSEVDDEILIKVGICKKHYWENIGN